MGPNHGSWWFGAALLAGTLVVGARASLEPVSQFSIVIDAGSTGCRLYVYQTAHDGTLTGKKGPKVKPGLSSFATHPEDLAAYVTPLFLEAQQLVAPSQSAYTKVFIKATAGMRLVTPEQERVIYDTLHEFLSTSPDVCPFSVSLPDLRTISGSDEGYFGALSANYLSGNIDSNRAVLRHGPERHANVLGALDLGGSSTQISMFTGDEHRVSHVEQRDFYVNSYLGFGVEKMGDKYRSALVMAAGSTPVVEDPCTPTGMSLAVGTSTLTGTGNYQQCLHSVAEAMGIGQCYGQGITGQRCVLEGVELPPVTERTKFLAMSVYFFALRTIKIFLSKTRPAAGDAMSWPSPSVDELSAAGDVFCSMQWEAMKGVLRDDQAKWEPFTGDADQREREFPERCFQTAYIELLLDKVYGIPRHAHNVMMALDINDMEVEWTLGSVLHNQGPVAGNNPPWADGQVESASFLRPTDWSGPAVMGLAMLVCLCCCCYRQAAAGMSTNGQSGGRGLRGKAYGVPP